MPSLTSIMLKFQKPTMSLKQFMLRSEVLKLYRGFMRLGRLLDAPPEQSPSLQNKPENQTDHTSTSHKKHALQEEWMSWVRSEFRLRQATTDEEIIRMMLAHGKRQLQEMERTILLATNRNATATSHKNVVSMEDKSFKNSS